jgi:hypothetical protein
MSPECGPETVTSICCVFEVRPRCETDRYIWFQLLTLAGWPVSVNEEERAGLPPQKKGVPQQL